MHGINAYLNFDGNCREAMVFYARCLGGDPQIMPFSEAGTDYPKEARDRVMHASLGSGATVLMASDTMPGTQFQPGNNFSICIQCESLEEIEKLFLSLSDKGTITMPLQDTFWGARFGMLQDRFGIHWMFNFEKPRQK